MPTPTQNQVDFGGAMGSTGGQRIPQVRYTLAGPYGSAFSVSAEQPTVSVEGPGGQFTNDSNVGGLPAGPGTGTISATCNGVPCAGAGTAAQGNIAKAIAPNLTVASYWAQPWGHVDFAGVLVPMEFNDGHFISREYLGYGGHFSGDVKPGWFGWSKDDFLFSFHRGRRPRPVFERRVGQCYGDGEQFQRRDRVRNTRGGLPGRQCGV